MMTDFGRNDDSCADAWEALKIVHEWIKHAEIKASIALAGSGVVGGILYTLVTAQARSNAMFIAAATSCALCVFVAALAACVALRPRLRTRGAPTSLLYHRHVALHFHDDVSSYTHALTALLGDRRALGAAIAEQIWENAHVARKKYRWSEVSMFALIGSLATSAALAAIAALNAS